MGREDYYTNCIIDMWWPALYEWYGQTFIAHRSYNVKAVKLSLTRAGNGAELIVSICATSGGIPVGEDLVVGTTDGTTLPDDEPEWREIIFPETYSLTEGVQYAIVAKSPEGDWFNCAIWWGNEVDEYPNGTAVASYDDGENWEIYEDYECAFETYSGKAHSPNPADGATRVDKNITTFTWEV